MSKKNAPVAQDPLANVEDALTQSEIFIEKNRNKIIIAVVAIAAVVLGFFAYNKYVSEPKEMEAQAKMFRAEFAFEKDSFNLALNGNANQAGFLQIIEDYGSTTSGNLANYYIGICYLNLGKFEDAITYLKKYDGNDVMVRSVAMGAQADALVELGKIEEAIELYVKAAGQSENTFTSPIYLMKAGACYEETAKFDKALEVYKKVRKDFFQTNEGREIDKHITRVEGLMGNLQAN
jgi:tetratricopeptide (TPR) repeat protein